MSRKNKDVLIQIKDTKTVSFWTSSSLLKVSLWDNRLLTYYIELFALPSLVSHHSRRVCVCVCVCDPDLRMLCVCWERVSVCVCVCVCDSDLRGLGVCVCWGWGMG